MRINQSSLKFDNKITKILQLDYLKKKWHKLKQPYYIEENSRIT